MCTVSLIASSLPYIDAALDPDKVDEASNLDGVDVGVVEGRVAVAENGCVWIPQTMKERTVLFISEYLVIIIDRKDIAQALVMGAQAARSITVLVR